MVFYCLILLGLVSDGAEQTSSWLRFRGPNGSGQATGFQWPAQWNEQAIRWKVALPGRGYGSPIVHAGRVYLQSSDQQGKERLVLCINSSDGSTAWQQKLPGKRAAAMHQKNSLASGTAATDGTRVYFCHWDGEAVQLAAYACSDGKPLWSKPLGKHQSQHGAGYSPILVKNKVIVANDGDNHAEVFCFDAVEGKQLWSQERKHYRASYGTPLIYSLRGAEEVIVSSTAGIAGYDLETGQRHWNWEWPFATKPLRSVSSPVLCSGNILLAAAGDGGGDRDTVAVQLPTGDTSSTRDAKLLWQLRRDIPYVTCLLEQKQHIYFVADKGVAGCLDLATGKEKWSQRLAGNFTASPLLVDNKVISVNEEGEVFVFVARSEKYEAVGRLKLHETVLASPAMAEGCLFVRGQEHLFCLGAVKK